MTRGALASLLFLLAAPSAAHAMCAPPHGVLLPEDGASLPPNPTVYLFVPKWLAEGSKIEVRDGGGRRVKFASEVVTSVDAFVVHRIRVKAAAGEIAVGFSRREEGPLVLAARYSIGPILTHGENTVTKINSVETESTSWTCSFQATRNLHPSIGAPAYRLEWAATEESWREGRRESMVLPSRMEGFFRRKGEKALTGEKSQLELGHVDCIGWTFEWNGPIWAGIAALHEDGTETPPGADPVKIEPAMGRRRFPGEPDSE